jgi:hypothetical protein
MKKQSKVNVAPNLEKISTIIDKDGNKLDKIKGNIIERKIEPYQPSKDEPKSSISSKIEEKINAKINEIVDKKIEEILNKML